jgi:hypothetical protein
MFKNYKPDPKLPRYDPADDKPVVSLDTEKLPVPVFALVLVIVPSLIVAPMFALYAVPSMWARIGVLWAFAIVFACATGFLAGRNLDLILATSAAYVYLLLTLRFTDADFNADSVRCLVFSWGILCRRLHSWLPRRVLEDGCIWHAHSLDLFRFLF